MRSFKDRLGQDRTIDLSFGLLRSVRTKHNIDLLKFFDKDQTHRNRLLESSDETFFNVLMMLTQTAPEYEAVFAESMDKESFEAAGQCLVLALIDYFPPEKRAALEQALRRTQEAALDLQTERMELALRAVEEVPMEKIKEAMRRHSTGNVPPSSVSTQTPST